jgi:hypothetical protein
MASKDSGPASWQDALSQASQAIAGGLAAPDADVKFGLAILGAMAEHSKKGSGGPGAGTTPGGPPGGGQAGPPPAGGPPPSPGGDQLSPAAGGSSVTGPAGGGAPNSKMMSNAAPGGPVPGGMSPGLSPNPDELRRVLADVAGK